MPTLVIALAMLLQPVDQPRTIGPAPPPRRGGARTANVVLRCTADYRTRMVSDCEVVSEAPAGRGFGDAALKTTAKMKLPAHYKPKGDETTAVVVIPLSFSTMD